MEDSGAALAFFGLGATALATSLVTLKTPPGAVQGQASLAGRPRPHVAAGRFALAVLRIRRERGFSAPTVPRRRSRRAAAMASCGWRRCTRRASPRRSGGPPRSPTASPICNSPTAYRVPFQYSRFVRKHLRVGAFVQSSDGRDGHRPRRQPLLRPDRLLRRQPARQRRLQRDDAARRSIGCASSGRCSAPYHPVVADNVRRLQEISGLDEVSFHMSGTEAVMQAVRLARYHTRRSHLVRFCGAYHGWWGDVQPGVGNPVPARETYTLDGYVRGSLRVLRTRRDIACVLVNPLQSLHPNGSAPADTSLVDSAGSAHFDKAAYADWLRRLRAVCTERNIVLIFDEVFVGFRLAPGRRPGVFRRARRSCDLWQDGRWRIPGRRGLRPPRLDEALPRRPAGRHLFRPRHLQLASCRHGRHGRVPAAPGNAGDSRALSRISTSCGMPERGC